MCTATNINSIYLWKAEYLKNEHHPQMVTVWLMKQFVSSLSRIPRCSPPWVPQTTRLLCNEYAFSRSECVIILCAIGRLCSDARRAAAWKPLWREKIVPLPWWNWVLHFHQILNKTEGWWLMRRALCVCVSVCLPLILTALLRSCEGIRR